MHGIDFDALAARIMSRFRAQYEGNLSNDERADLAELDRLDEALMDQLFEQQLAEEGEGNTPDQPSWTTRRDDRDGDVLMPA